MGFNCSAYTIVGSLIDEVDLYRVEHLDVHRDCGTKYVKKFCPDCGELAGKTEKINTPIEGYDPEGGEDYTGSINGRSILCVGWGGLSTSFVPSLVCLIRDGDMYGRGPKQETNATRLEDFNLDEHREQIKSILKPAGLWDPSKFGIWTALYGG